MKKNIEEFKRIAAQNQKMMDTLTEKPLPNPELHLRIMDNFKAKRDEALAVVNKYQNQQS